MQQSVFTIVDNLPLTSSVYRIRLQGDTEIAARPGQFVNLRLDGLFLRRPISICDTENSKLTLIYKIVGSGTRQLASMLPGQKLDLLTGLGNGFDLSLSGNHPLLLGGGVGVPPLYLLARRLLSEGKKVSAVLGFNTREEIFYDDAFRELGCDITVTTADGTAGIHGFVTDAIPDHYTFFYACGPEPMLKAVCKHTRTSGQLSLEERMGCGFGACMGCSCKTLTGSKRICKDGPVLMKEEILWAD